MITAALLQMIDQLPPEEYTMVEQYVNSIADMVAKHQKAKAWEKIKTDLIASEKSIKAEGTVSAEEMRKELGISKVLCESIFSCQNDK